METLLGSCVSVVLFDVGLRVGGLTHFMLPGEMGGGELVSSKNAKYGMYALDLLVNMLLKYGTSRGRLYAKVFGGASLLSLPSGRMNRIPQSNIEFAFEYLDKEKIPILVSDVGGHVARKIILFPDTGNVWLKRIGWVRALPLIKRDLRYFRRLNSLPSSGDVVLFDE
jgi:chemotaxis protein CheD